MTRQIKLRLLFIGDSITTGYPGTSLALADRFTTQVHDEVKIRHPNYNWDLLICGMGGMGSIYLNPIGDAGSYYGRLGHNWWTLYPSIVVIQISMNNHPGMDKSIRYGRAAPNDVYASFTEANTWLITDLNAGIDLLQAKGVPNECILVLGQAPCYSSIYEWFIGGAHEAEFLTRNTTIETLCNSQEVMFVPMADVYGVDYDAGTDPDDRLIDTAKSHPTVSGLALWAARINSYLPESGYIRSRAA